MCRGFIPQVFFVLHPAEAWNRSLKGAKLAITLFSRLFVYIHMHAQSQMTFYDAISGKLKHVIKANQNKINNNKIKHATFLYHL